MLPETTLNVMSLLSFFRALPFFCFQHNSQKKKMGITKAEKCSYSKMLSILTFRAWYSCTFWLSHSLMHIKFVAYLHPKSLLPPSFAASDLWYIQNAHPTTLSSPILFSVNSDFLTSLNTESSVPAGVPNSSQFANLHQSLTFPVRSTFYPLSRVCDWHHHDRNHPAERTDFAAQYSKTFRCWYCYIMLWNIWNCMKVHCWRGRFISSSTSILPFNVA